MGTLFGRLHIYDANTLQLQRTYHQAHQQRIGALAWNSFVLSSGSRDRLVHHRDVRDPSTRPFKRCTGHRQEVCGLKWSGDGGVMNATLASGGNDNKVCIWDLRGSTRSRSSTDPNENSTSTLPLWKFHEHTAAVKALAWDPHVPGLLATGGGTQDKHIRFWNVSNGTMLHELDTGSQVRPPPLHHLFRAHIISTGVQPHMVTDVSRASLNARLLIHRAPESNMYMEIPKFEHGGFSNGSYESCFISCHVS